MKRYQSPYVNKYIILFAKGWTKNKAKHSDTKLLEDYWKIVEQNYPAVARWLQPFEEQAKKRADKGDYWWEMRSCDYYNEFEKPKIMWAELASRNQFTLETRGLYGETTVFIMGVNELSLLAILNSSVALYFIQSIGSEVRGGFLRWKRQYLSQLPIPAVTAEQQAPIVTLVEQVLAAKAADSLADTSVLEKQIDVLVARLYGLTDAETQLLISDK